jgi:uncharacterized membrane protein YagU involved in acid resistance
MRHVEAYVTATTGGNQIMFDNINFKRAVLAGLVGTTAMTGLMLAAPMMGMPRMNIGEMLGSMMGGVTALGWVAHFMIGTTLAIAYAAFFAERLPGPPVVRGMLFGIAPWLLAQVVVMPMMGTGFFSGSLMAATGSLMGHLVYGAAVGTIYRPSDRAFLGHALHADA